MTKRVDRREFVKAGALAGAAGLAVGRPAVATEGQAPAVLMRGARPVVVASANGNFYRNGGDETAVARAFRLMTSGQDVLESLVAGANIVELDPEEDSVGYGGIPNADGVVQLDSCVMHGAKKRAGAVAALEGVRTPSRVALAVADQTDHHLIVGKGAQDLARLLGFTVEDDLNTEHSRKAWLEWKRRTDPTHYLDPDKRSGEWDRVTRQLAAEGLLRSLHRRGTIHMNAVGPGGDVAGVTTTSGLFFKIPGRVGDSPILGAGNYAAGGVGAAGSTGRGEANLFNLSCFLIVEELRRGTSPKDAGLAALRRIADNTQERRLLNGSGAPAFNVSFYVTNAAGQHAGVALYAEDEEERGWAGQTHGRAVRYSFCDENGPRTVPVEALLPGTPQG